MPSNIKWQYRKIYYIEKMPDILIFILMFTVIGALGVLCGKLDKAYKRSLKDQFNNENCEFTSAVIYELEKFRSNTEIHYNYTVDGRKYKGWGEWHPYEDTFSVGDTIEIIYLKRDPDKSIAKRDFEKW
jgi:hypothetical protein